MINRVLRGLRDTVRLLSPSVRAARAYTMGRQRLIAEACAKAMRGSDWLDGPRYGAGFDERVIEYPWTCARLARGSVLLDVGSTMNNEAMIALASERYQRVVFLNPYQDDGFRSADHRVRYLRADARSPSLGMKFGVITCLSTLEHIGGDNARYGAGGPASRNPAAGRRDAARALRSLLEPGGRLLLTVPFGKLEDHGWFVQLDEAALAEVIAAFAPSASTTACYLHDDGWREVPAASCRDASYGDGVPGARAVACVELVA